MAELVNLCIRRKGWLGGVVGYSSGVHTQRVVTVRGAGVVLCDGGRECAPPGVPSRPDGAGAFLRGLAPG